MTTRVSILMPVRNESDFISESLRAVLAQDYPADLMEVLVIDGRSEDDTRDIVEELAADSAARAGPRVILLDNPCGVAPHALNIALRSARGEVIVRVDGHCHIAPDYVRSCVSALERTGADNVGGVQRAQGHGVVGRAVALATSSPFGVGNARFRYSTRGRWVDTVYLGAYRREVFDRIGMFDEDLVRNQDDELNFRLVQAGGKIWLDPSIRSRYEPRASLGRLWRQYFEYGLYKVLVIRKRRGVASLRQLVPGGFVVAALGSVVGGAAVRRPLLAIAVVAPYIAATTSASVVTGWRDPAALVMLPMTFATLHFAYGIGFLAGLWKWRKWPDKHRTETIAAGASEL